MTPRCGQEKRIRSSARSRRAAGGCRHTMDERVRRLARTIWDYHQLNHALAPADAILVLCSHDTAVAERGAQLLLEGWAPLLIFSGGLGSITKRLWSEPEADQFAAIANAARCPRREDPDREPLDQHRREHPSDQAAPVGSRSRSAGLHRRAEAAWAPQLRHLPQAWPEKDLIVTRHQVTFDVHS